MVTAGIWVLRAVAAILRDGSPIPLLIGYVAVILAPGSLKDILKILAGGIIPCV